MISEGLIYRMRPLIVDDAQEMLLALQDEIRRSEEARYDHRLHGVLLVAQGMKAPEVARLLGDGVRTVEYWIERFNRNGFAGLVEGERSGRPRKLSLQQLEELELVLREPPRAQNISANLWDGKSLSHWLKQRWSVELSPRQCQRLFRQLGFRLRKPRPVLGSADPELQRAHKKTPDAGPRSKRGSLGLG
jgi:transposase